MSKAKWRTRIRGTPKQRGKKFILSERRSSKNLPKNLMIVKGVSHIDKEGSKYRVLEVDQLKLNGTNFLGENYYAAKELGHHFPYPKDVILIKKGLSPEEKRKTIEHELVEIALMKKGMKYKDAHKIAFASEKD